MSVGTGDPSELHAPLGVAVGPDGRIVVADTGATGGYSRLAVYDRAGRYVRDLQPPADAGVYFQPWAVAVTGGGAVYGLDGLGFDLYRFAPDGTYLGDTKLAGAAATTSAGPRANRVAAASDGSVWLRYDSGLVEHRSSDGTAIGSFSTAVAPAAPGLAITPDGLLVIGTAEYSTDGQLVRTLTGTSAAFWSAAAPDGRVITGFGDALYTLAADGSGGTELDLTRGTAPGQVNQMQGIAVAAPGALAAGRPAEPSLVVAEYGNHRVQVLALDGTPLQVIGEPQGSSLSRPLDAWSAPDGTLWVADTGHRRVVRYGLDGQYLGRADDGRDGYPTAGAYNPVTGQSVVVDRSTSTLRRYDDRGALVGEQPLPDGGTSFARVASVAIGANGDIYVPDDHTSSNGTVIVYRADGTLLRTVTGPPSGPGHMDAAETVAVGPGDELYVATNTAVNVYGPDGIYRRSPYDGLCRGAVSSIATDTTGLLFLTTPAGVIILDRAGEVLGTFSPTDLSSNELAHSHLSVVGSILTITEPDEQRVVRYHLDRSALTTLTPAACGTVTFIAPSVKTTATRTTLSLSCDAGLAPGCSGGVTLIRATAPATPRPADVLATAVYRLSTHTTGKITLKLPTRERRTLRTKRKLRTRLLIQTTSGATTRRTITLRLPKIHHKAK